MSANGKVGFTGSMPENYDRYLGPVHFEPFADDLSKRVAAARPQEAVLEIACGTGIVTKRLRAGLPASVRLVATDLSQAMLDYASAKLADTSIQWQQADATALPFEAGSFGAVACGFGVMFVPDKPLAFREARRVLARGGTFVFNVWDGFEGNECSRIVFETMRTLLTKKQPEFLKIPFAFNDGDLIRQLLAREKFDAIEIKPVTIHASCPTARDFAIGVLRGTPAGNEIQQEGIPFDEAVDTVGVALARALGDKPLRIERRALVVKARAA
jgi:ubiquinone/menaquinone biosynthesis C-methylase UbiE